jgi:hypothetical protein
MRVRMDDIPVTRHAHEAIIARIYSIGCQPGGKHASRGFALAGFVSSRLRAPRAMIWLSATKERAEEGPKPVFWLGGALPIAARLHRLHFS